MLKNMYKVVAKCISIVFSIYSNLIQGRDCISTKSVQRDVSVRCSFERLCDIRVSRVYQIWKTDAHLLQTPDRPRFTLLC